MYYDCMFVFSLMMHHAKSHGDEKTNQ